MPASPPHPTARVRPGRYALLVLVVVLIASPWSGRTVGADEEAAKAEKKPPMLWVVEGEVPTYLLGTLPLLDDRLYAVPEVVEQAMTASDVFVSEVPLDLASLAKLQTAQMLPAGQTLKEYVGEALYARIKKLIPRTFPEMYYRQFNPLAVMSILELRKSAGAALQFKMPVPFVLRSRFAKAGKETVALERGREQLALFAKLTKEEQIKALEGTVKKVEKEAATGEDGVEKLVTWYLAGDHENIAAYTRLSLGTDKVVNAKLVKLMLDDRAATLARRLIARLEASPKKTHFAVLSVGYFGGSKGLLAHLEKQGKTIRRIKADDKITPRKKAAAGG